MTHSKYYSRSRYLRSPFMGLVLTALTATAQAATNDQQVDIDFDMECTFPLIGPVPVHVSGTADIPKAVLEGVAFTPRFDIKASFDGSASGGLKLLNIASLSPKIDVMAISYWPDGVTYPIYLSPTLADGDLIEVDGIASGISVESKLPYAISHDRKGRIFLEVDRVKVGFKAFEADGSLAAGDFQSFSDDCTMNSYLFRDINIIETDQKIIANDSFIDFGRLESGMQLTKRVTYENIATEATEITRVYVKDAIHFSVSEDTCIDQTLLPSETCSVEIRYTANSGFSRNVDVLLLQESGGTHSVLLRGLPSVASGVVDVPARFGFGTVFYGDTKQKSLTISNQGSKPLSIYSAETNLNKFKVVSSSCNTVAIGESCTLDITYSPVAGKAFDDAELTITSDDSVNGVTTISLRGEAGERPEIPLGDSKVDVELSANGAVNFNSRARGTLPLQGTFDGTIDREGGGLELNFDFEEAKSEGMTYDLFWGFRVPLSMTAEVIQVKPISGKIENLKLTDVDAEIELKVTRFGYNFFGFNSLLKNGEVCTIRGGRGTPFNVESFDLSGAPIRISADLGGGSSTVSAGCPEQMKSAIAGEGSAALELNLTFTSHQL